MTDPASQQNPNDHSDMGWRQVGAGPAQAGAVLHEGPPLSAEQVAAVEIVLAGFRAGKRRQSLVGWAGTGKTTTIRGLIKLWSGRVWIAAPTNKAALRATEATGTQATTIHAVVARRPFVDEESGALHGFDWIGTGEADLADGDLLVCDEASMIGEMMLARIMNALPTVVKVLFVGDPAQLPPIKDRVSTALLSPDAVLTEVHRQQADSQLLDWATQVRTELRVLSVDLVRSWGQPVHRLTLVEVGAAALRGGWGQILVSTNRTRWLVNEAVRRVANKPPLKAGPCKGDRVTATTNHHESGIVNGEQGVVISAKEGFPVNGEAVWFMRVKWDVLGEKEVLVPKNSWCPQGPVPWNPEEAKKVVSRLRTAHTKLPLIGVQAAWAVTVHRFQGSEVDQGAIILEHWSGSDGAKLAYTALTRFKSSVDFVSIADLRTDSSRLKHQAAPLVETVGISDDDPCFYDI